MRRNRRKVVKRRSPRRALVRHGIDVTVEPDDDEEEGCRRDIQGPGNDDKPETSD
jgi:hypothetical protein